MSSLLQEEPCAANAASFGSIGKNGNAVYAAGERFDPDSSIMLLDDKNKPASFSTVSFGEQLEALALSTTPPTGVLAYIPCTAVDTTTSVRHPAIQAHEAFRSTTPGDPVRNDDAEPPA